MLAAVTPAAVSSVADAALAPLAPNRAMVPLGPGGAARQELVPTGLHTETPAPEALPARNGDRFDPRQVSPREIAKRSLDLYAGGLLTWEDHAVLAFQPELHPDYDRTVGALLGTKAAPDKPRDFVAVWEQRLVFELRYNAENDQAVTRARRIVGALRRTAGEETDVSV